MFLPIVVHLLLLHSPDGQLIELNPHEISSIMEPRVDQHTHGSVKCVITMTNGKFFGVAEDCKTVTEKFEKALE
jgi:uncharacterized protein YlzI (FlbEa/FlbD family)